MTDSVEGFVRGQVVWFTRDGLVLSAAITGFRTWITQQDRFKADLISSDGIIHCADVEDLFTGEVPATEHLLAETRKQAAYLRRRLKDLARQTTKVMEGSRA